MAYVDWMIKGPKIGACSCDYGCPCEFNAPPTRGHCEGLEAHRIDEGHFGEVPLAGLVVAAWYCWPGPVHEGGGIAQEIIERRADERQREALLNILDVEEQAPTRSSLKSPSNATWRPGPAASAQATLSTSGSNRPRTR